MKPTLVTGATGFLGWHVARLLEERGHSVRALVRPGSKLRELAAEPVTGDLRDPASLERAAAGCGLVFHVAADYRLWAARSRRTLPLQCRRHAQCAGSGAPGGGGAGGLYQHGGVHWDSARRGGRRGRGRYAWRTWRGTTSAPNSWPSGWPWNSPRRDLPVVIVNPTAPIGDHDVKPTPTGQIVLDFLRGAMPACDRYRPERGGRARYGGGPPAGVRARQAGGAVYSGQREPHAAGNSAEAGGNYGSAGAAVAHPARGGLCRGGRDARAGRG